MPRGPVGSAAGLPSKEVDRRLVSLVTRLHSQHGLAITSLQALEALREMFPEDTPEQHLAVRRTLLRLPGAHVRQDDGYVVLPSRPLDAIKHRHWRLSLGYLDINDAARLHEVVASMSPLSPGLERLSDRLHTALYAALGDGWDEYLL